MNLVKKFEYYLLKNNSVKQTIFKNTFWLILTEVIQKGIAFLVIVQLARYFGPVIYGKWMFALSFVTFFSVLADFGFSILMIKKIAIDKSKTSLYIDNIIAMKLVLGLFSLSLIFIVIQFLGKDQEMLKLVYFLGIYAILNTFAVFFQSIFRANEKMQYETVVRIIQSLSLLALVTFFVLNKSSIFAISYAYIGVALIGILFSLIFTLRYFSKFFLKINLKICKKILLEAWPFTLSAIFATIYFKIDTIFLSIMRSDLEVGIYSAAYTLIILTYLLPEFLTISIFPWFSRLFLEDSKALIEHFKKLFKYLFFLGLIVTVLAIVVAPFIINIVYGEQYESSIIIFQVLAITILLKYVNYSTGISLSSVNLQKERVKGQFITVIINVGINIILIPVIGIYGAVISTIISEVVLGISYYYFLNKKFFKVYST